jgi:hypothetical protein
LTFVFKLAAGERGCQRAPSIVATSFARVHKRRARERQYRTA